MASLFAAKPQAIFVAMVALLVAMLLSDGLPAPDADAGSDVRLLAIAPSQGTRTTSEVARPTLGSGDREALSLWDDPDLGMLEGLTMPDAKSTYSSGSVTAIVEPVSTWSTEIARPSGGPPKPTPATDSASKPAGTKPPHPSRAPDRVIPEGAINVVDHGVAGDGATNDTLAIQSVLDAAEPGAVVYFPDVSPGFYRLDDSVDVHKPVTLLGAGLAAGSELRQTTPGRSGFEVYSSNVTVDGLRLIGPGYTDFAGDSAIHLKASDADRLTNINVLNTWIQSWSDSAIRWSFVNDFIIRGNHIEDNTYAGVLVISGFRGLIADNDIEDIGDPDTGTALLNAYPISVTSQQGAPYSKDIIIRNNVVRKNPVWTGIMNHGGTRILVDSNTVNDADVAYANTWVPESGVGSDNVLFINNLGTNAGRNSLWLVGADNTPTREVGVIGNRFSNSAALIAYNQADATITWNAATATVGVYGALRTRLVNTNLTIAHNDWGGAVVSGDGSVLTFGPEQPVPSAPTSLTATRKRSSIVIRWNHPTTSAHDSFFIEHRTESGGWEPLAYRPPNDGKWAYDAPTNPEWAPFDPLSYRVEGLGLGATHEFRVRAQLGAATSEWSNAADA